MLYNYKGFYNYQCEVLVHLHHFRQMRSNATFNHIKEKSVTVLFHCVFSISEDIYIKYLPPQIFY